MLPRTPQARTAKADQSRAINRTLLLAVILLFWMAGLISRLYYLQVIDYGNLLARAQRQQQHVIEVAPQRGQIFDRQMNPLAMSLGVDSVFAVPSEIPDAQMVVNLLAPVLGLDPNDLLGRFTNSHSFCWVKRKVTTEEANRVRDLGLKGVYFQREPKRFYPKGNLAAHVVGYVGLDDKGLSGLEYGLESTIRGRPGRVLVATDARRRTFQSTQWEGEQGKNVVLTLDEKIQYIADKALEEAVQKWKAAGGVAIVQNPNTGEILAMSSQPTFNPNDFARSQAEALENRGLAWVYEPGSTFKLVTVSAALEHRLVNPDEVINCQRGSIVLAGHVIHDHKSYADLTLTDVVANSSDVGAIKLGLRLGQDRLYESIRKFGFGDKTDIELPGEERGLLKPPARWSGLSIGEISMGQEVGVTPVQLVTAYSAIANNGVLFEPRIVHDIFLGQAHDALPPVPGHRIVSERTAAIMKQILAAVVERGTGKPAQLVGYTSGGKTGTAQKIEPSGAYSKTHYVASFVGFAPVGKPAVTILVAIDSPTGSIYGTEVAAPVFKSIAEQCLGYLNVPQDISFRESQIASSTPARTPSRKLEIPAGHLPVDSERPRTATSPVQPASYAPGGPAQASPDREPEAAAMGGTILVDDANLKDVPNFTGWAARNVAQHCQKLGLELSVVGSGLVVEQNPPAHARVPAGTRLVVRLSR